MFHVIQDLNSSPNQVSDQYQKRKEALTLERLQSWEDALVPHQEEDALSNKKPVSPLEQEFFNIYFIYIIKYTKLTNPSFTYFDVSMLFYYILI